MIRCRSSRCVLSLLGVFLAAGCSAVQVGDPPDAGWEADAAEADGAGEAADGEAIEETADVPDDVPEADLDADDTSETTPPECVDDGDCEDSFYCTSDLCDPATGTCSHAPMHAACDDGNVCTGAETCDPDAGCLPGTAIDCGDGIDCTQDRCDPLTGGCRHEADHRRCTAPQLCLPDRGGCAVPPPCTVDAECDDGNPCNGAETCGGAAGCLAGAPVDCNDGIACTRDACDTETGACLNAADDALCDNHNLCDGLETCSASAGCLRGTPVDCDDRVACTDDACNPSTGECRHTANDGRCDDGRYCNGAEFCDAATGCRSGSVPACSDGVACTRDVCDAAADACVHTVDHAVCDDRLYCNGGETCSASAGCVPGTPPVCDDGLACTANACDPAAGGGAGACVFTSPDADGDTYPDAACTGSDCNDADPAVHPGRSETCNAVDDDCDTLTDETFGCARGAVRGCTLGACTGSQSCNASCNWDACVVAATETCNGVDDNCNGVADEGFDCVLGSIQGCAVGACPGTRACGAGCAWGGCTVTATETCNGTDDDCDGLTDEGFTCVAGRTESCSVGACAGTRTCSPVCAWGGCTVSATEICNGADDDCNGATDEIFECTMGATGGCSNGCGVGGSRTCAAGTCTWGACCAATESCGNSCDDNCNGVVNEGCCSGGDSCDCYLTASSSGGTYSGSTSGLANDFTASCGGGAGSPDAIYRLVLTGTAQVTVDTIGSGYDTVLHLRSGATCPGAEIACDDDGGGSLTSRIAADLSAGTYWIVVDGYSSGGSGSYTLHVNVVTGTGEDCSSYRTIGAPGTFTGNTCSYVNNYTAGCGGSANSPDVVYRLDLPSARTVTLNLCGSSYDTVVFVRSGVCASGSEVGCNDDNYTYCSGAQSYLTLSLSAGTYYVFVDGYSSGSCGAYSMTVSY